MPKNKDKITWSFGAVTHYVQILTVVAKSHDCVYMSTGPEVIKRFPCSTSEKFQLLIKTTPTNKEVACF